MAAPSIAAVTTSVEATTVTAHDITLPASVAGDLIIVIFATHGDNSVSDWDGFTSIFSVNRGTSAHLSFAYMKATSASVPGTAIQITTAFAETSAHVAYKISGHIDPATQAPEASTGAGGFSNAPNPDSLTPTGGSKDYLFIAGMANQADGTPLDGFPTSYSISQQELESGGVNNCTVASAGRQLTAASDDPGTFDLVSTTDRAWAAGTLAIHPAAATGNPYYAYAQQ